jgi:hypothetical protein
VRCQRFPRQARVYGYDCNGADAPFALNVETSWEYPEASSEDWCGEYDMTIEEAVREALG